VRGFDPLAFIDRKEAKRLDRFAHLAMAAALMAVEDAKLSLDREVRERIGVLIGSGIVDVQAVTP